MTLVAVTSSKFVRGVDSPADDWRTENERNVRACFRVVDLEAALARAYDVDAHLVTYVVSRDGVPLVEQPRVNKDGLAFVLAQGFTLAADVLFVDLDNPDHVEWTEGAVEQALERYATLPVLATVGVYHTTHGARLVQPLDEPVAVPHVEAYLEAWLDELEQAGLTPDRACRDWTRLFRLPHVRRGRVDYRSPHVDLSRMSPRRIAPVPLRPKELPRARAAGRPLARWARSASTCPLDGRAAST